MRRGGQKGYTILEVLIFIAVSSLMFITVINTFSGRQQQVQFAQSTREFDAKIRDIINDVTTGYYPTNPTVECSFALNNTSISSSSGERIGTNNDCVYIGKAVQFSSNSIKVYSLAGQRYSDNNSPVSSIAEAKPQAVSLLGDVNFQETSEDYTPLYGLEITRVIRPISDSLVTEYGAIGILSDFSGASVSESQSVQIGGIVGSQFGANETDALSIINQLTDLVQATVQNGFIEKNTEQGIVICLRNSENNDKKASLSFGSRGDSTTVLQIDDYNRGCDL